MESILQTETALANSGKLLSYTDIVRVDLARTGASKKALDAVNIEAERIRAVADAEASRVIVERNQILPSDVPHDEPESTLLLPRGWRELLPPAPRSFGLEAEAKPFVGLLLSEEEAEDFVDGDKVVVFLDQTQGFVLTPEVTADGEYELKELPDGTPGYAPLAPSVGQRKAMLRAERGYVLGKRHIAADGGDGDA